jgi:hypothetical protein
MKLRIKIQKMEITMLIRTTIAALALVVASTTGSLAAEKKQSNDAAYRAFAAQPQSVQTQAAQKRHSANPANDVYDIRGRYVGSDPDPTVRAQIARDRDVD